MNHKITVYKLHGLTLWYSIIPVPHVPIFERPCKIYVVKPDIHYTFVIICYYCEKITGCIFLASGIETACSNMCFLETISLQIAFLLSKNRLGLVVRKVPDCERD